MAGAPYTPEYLRTESRKPAPPKEGAARGNRALFLVGGALVAFAVVAFVAGLVLPGLAARETMPDTPREVAAAPEATSSPEAAGGVPVEPEERRPVGEKRPGGGPLRLTVPKMARVDGISVRAATPEQTARLDAGAIRLRGTGLPWQREANVYIAGHRVGYAGTGSFLLFFDLDRLEEGDEVLLEGGGRRYVYRVTEKLVVGPEESRAMEPVPGKNIVSLQTCTLPDYRKRLIVRAELEEVRPGTVPGSRA